MIKILAGNNLILEVDSNPNGLPYLIISIAYGAQSKGFAMLSKNNVEELIQELQKKLTEL